MRTSHLGDTLQRKSLCNLENTKVLISDLNFPRDFSSTFNLYTCTLST